jgi:hypothetical protein
VTEAEGLPFMIGRIKTPRGNLISLQVPVTAAIVTMMFLGGSRHHPAACSVLGELCMVISDSDLEENLDGSLLENAERIRVELSDNRHKPVVSRFFKAGDSFIGTIHPMELYAMGISCEGFLDDIGRDEPSVYTSLETWAKGASKLVEEREMLAIYEMESVV